MTKISKIAAIIMIVCAMSLVQGENRDYGVIKNQDSPKTKLKSVDLDDVRWTDGFWARRFAQTRDVTLPKLWELASDPEAGHAIQNLKIAAGIEKGQFAGTHWQDAWIYKWLGSACYVYAATGDQELGTQIDRIVDVIARAQQPDGYIASQTTARGWPRFQDPHHHELYTMGHLLTAACIHHRLTGKSELLEVACRAADCVYETFRARDPKLADFPRNPSIIMGAVELYRTTGKKKYLDMANFFIDWRGSRYGDGRRNTWGGPVTNGSDLNQNWRPLRKETEVVGHAVFFTYLYAGAADAYMQTGDETLLAALERLWTDLVTKKMYVTGGVSPEHKSHPARRMICCPTNLMRIVASWHNYLYSVDDTGLWIHHYGANVFDGELDDGRRLRLTQQTDYPWDGKVRIRVDNVGSGGAFCIRLRIPGWAQGAELTVNGEASQIECREASYVRVERQWAAGDVIELDIPMPVRIVVADPRIEQTRNQVAVTRGPIVYCLESVDVPEGIRFEDICLPRRPKWKVQYEGDLLGGVTALRTGALVIERDTRPDIGGYRQLSTVLGRSAGIAMIPYYAWNNREEPKMTVWLPIRW